MVDKDPRYLRNQSRAAHKRHRQLKRDSFWSLVAWLIVVGHFVGRAAVDLTARRGWRSEPRDVWGGLLMMLGGVVVWAIHNLINDAILALMNHKFGPEPEGPVEA
jgi:4-hydroxybenzoate polyprenyltransferase